jgi:CubicO group peptidase (beta-lactamase class C family)
MDSAALFNPDKTLSWVGTELAEGRLAAAGIEVFLHGQSVLSECIGARNSTGDPVTPDTRFWIASMTKPIVSIVALKLVEQGKLSLADPVSGFVAGFGDAGVITVNGDCVPTTRKPTIHDLMTHTCGLTYGQFGDDEIHQRYSRVGAFDYMSTNAKMAEALRQLPLLYQPGTTFEYGMSTDLLGHIIERVTNLPLDRVLQNLVFEPLEMSSTSFHPDHDNLAELAPSIIRDTIAPDFSRSPSWFSGGAGLFSTVSDYLKFARMLLNGGTLEGVEIVQPDTFDLMTRPALSADIQYGTYTEALGISAPWEKNGLSFGLGLAVRIEEIAGIPGGMGECSWPGVSGCNFWADRKNRLVVVFLTHAPLHRTTHRVQLRQAIYGGLSL